MKRESKNILVLSLSLFIIAVIAINVSLVSAESVGASLFNKISFGSIDFSGFSDLFKSGDLLGITALLFFLVTLIIFAVSNSVPFLEGQGLFLRWTISIVIGILSTWFLQSTEIYTILQSYTALGITLTLVIPFVFLAVISKQLYDKQYYLTSKLLWVIFLVLICYKFLTADTAQIGQIGTILFIAIAAFALIMAIWENRIYLLMFKQNIRNARDTATAERLAEVTSELEELAERIRTAPSDAVRNPIIQRYNRRVRYQKSLGGNYRLWRP